MNFFTGTIWTGWTASRTWGPSLVRNTTPTWVQGELVASWTALAWWPGVCWRMMSPFCQAARVDREVRRAMIRILSMRMCRCCQLK